MGVQGSSRSSNSKTFRIDPIIFLDEFLDDFFQNQIVDQLFDDQWFVRNGIEMTDFVQIFFDTRATISDANCNETRADRTKLEEEAEHDSQGVMTGSFIRS